MAKLTSLKLSFSPSIPQPQIAFLTAQIWKILFALSPSAPQPQAAKKPSVNWSLPFLTDSFQYLLPPQPRPSRLALQIMTLVFPPSFSSTQMYSPFINCCSGLIPPLLKCPHLSSENTRITWRLAAHSILFPLPCFQPFFSVPRFPQTPSGFFTLYRISFPSNAFQSTCYLPGCMQLSEYSLISP